jgi:hypothetical protein
MDIEALKGMFRDVLRDYPELHAQYQYDEKRSWFGICISDDYHHTYSYATETDQVDLNQIRKNLDAWIKLYSG